MAEVINGLSHSKIYLGEISFHIMGQSCEETHIVRNKAQTTSE